jgi:Uncharacterised nucleotidyltransferase
MREQAAQLIGEVEWTRLAQTLRARRLLGVLGPRILELAGDSASEEFAKEVEQTIEAGRRRGAFLQLVSLRMTAMLADAGIRSSVLKGPFLSEAIHGDPGRRPSSDIDLLVAPEELHTAVEVVRQLGYGAPTDHLDEDRLPLMHLVLRHERGELPPVELHWRIHWYERRFACERLLPPAVDPSGNWRPTPVDELGALLLFYARDGFIDLRLVSDLSAWWDIRGTDLPATGLAPLLDPFPELARVMPAAAYAAERVGGLPARLTIGENHALGLRGQMAVRLANPNPRSSTSQLYADMSLIDGLLAPPGGLRAFVGRQLLPPSEVLDQQARHGSRRRARSPVGRLAGVLGRYWLRIARLPRRPETLSSD